jgi:uncharacterized membrane protein YjgN (DUF898 family)
MSELASAPAMPPAADLASAVLTPQPQRLQIRFTGKGGEYFRIWIVNLLLTLLTLGIWSAWAKVRKTRYFWTNTQLGGAAFQYHGNPVAILRGRLLAAAFFVAYSVAGRISVSAGMVAGVVLVLLGPWFFFKSMRFKLANTSWRGLRFGFESTASEAYLVLAPAAIAGVIFFATFGMAERFKAGAWPHPWAFLVSDLMFLALLPWGHARIKAYQHGHARYGTLSFNFLPSTAAFYGVYRNAFVIALPCGVLAVFLAVAIAKAMVGSGAGPEAAKAMFFPMMAVVYALMMLVNAVVGSYVAARLQRLVWASTHATSSTAGVIFGTPAPSLGPVRFSTTVGALRLMRLWVVSGLLTLLTLGLYWPFAAVAIARYRLECTTVEAAEPLESIAAGGLSPERSATGEGAVDFFGWDIGL